MMILGADVGSTGCNAACSEYSVYICGSYESTRFRQAQELTLKSKDAVFARLPKPPPPRGYENNFGGISAVAVTSFGESFVALDGDMNPLAGDYVYRRLRRRRSKMRLDPELNIL